MVATDLGFLAYWTATASRLIPPYPERVLVEWNWSFLVLDVVAAVTGLLSVPLMRRRRSAARGLRFVSLALTHAAGLNALMFWAVRGEFDLAWWLPNLWLALFPVAAVAVLLCRLDLVEPAEGSVVVVPGR